MADNHKEVAYVRNHLPNRVLLEGMAEECCELAQAALKLIRAVDGINPTPASPEACLEKLHEEVGDVLMVIEALGLIHDGMTAGNPKWERWMNRIIELGMKDRSELGMESKGKTQKELASVNGVIVTICSKCGCRVAFANDRFCRGCAKEFEA